MKGLKEYKNVFDLIDNFKTEEKCISYLEKLYWPEAIISPFDKTSKVYILSERNTYMCKNTQKKFTVKNFTIFLNSNISLRKWFVIFYLYFQEEKTSILKISKLLNLTYKTSWLLIKKIKDKLEECKNIYEGKIIAESIRFLKNKKEKEIGIEEVIFQFYKYKNFFKAYIYKKFPSLYNWKDDIIQDSAEELYIACNTTMSKGINDLRSFFLYIVKCRCIHLLNDFKFVPIDFNYDFGIYDDYDIEQFHKQDYYDFLFSCLNKRNKEIMFLYLAGFPYKEIGVKYKLDKEGVNTVIQLC